MEPTTEAVRRPYYFDRKTFDRAPDPLLLADPDGRVVRMNTALRAWTGNAKEDGPPGEIAGLLDSDGQDRLREAFREVLADGITRLCRACWKVPDESRPVLLSISILPVNGAETEYLLIAVAPDGGDRKNGNGRPAGADLARKLEQVERAKNEWERTMDCIRDMVILADRNGKIKRINRAVCEFMDLGYGEILGRDWEELIEEHHLNPTTFLSDGTEFFHEPTGRWFNFNARPFRDAADGEITGSAILIYDVTDQKKVAGELEEAYDQLKQTQSQILQQEKMASVGQLAAGVAHEINNPMGFIASNFGTLEKYVTKLVSFIETQDRALSRVKDPAVLEEITQQRKKLKLDYIIDDVKDLIAESLDGADRVKTIVQNLKSFSRVDQAEQSMANLNECVESTLAIVWNELKYKCTVTKDYGEIPLTRCFPQQLNQVFMNLMVNGAHAIEKQGEIRIRTREEGGFIQVRVEDTGSGIPEEKIGRIFEPFFTTKPVGKGTGLGLSIAYDIVKKHNGDIQVESEPGKGTAFTVQVPVIEKYSENDDVNEVTT